MRNPAYHASWGSCKEYVLGTRWLWSLMVRNQLLFQWHQESVKPQLNQSESHRALSRDWFCFSYILMTFQMDSHSSFICSQMTQLCPLQLRAWMTVMCYSKTWTNWMCGSPDVTWTSTPSKCQVLRVSTCRKAANFSYKLPEQVLEVVSSVRYLGVDISSGLSWNSHFERITTKANITGSCVIKVILKPKTVKSVRLPINACSPAAGVRARYLGSSHQTKETCILSCSTKLYMTLWQSHSQITSNFWIPIPGKCLLWPSGRSIHLVVIFINTPIIHLQLCSGMPCSRIL